MFVRRGFQMLISQSFAKNCGLYGERIGALHVVCSDVETTNKVLSQVKLVIRPMYSNPPLHGALIVSKILSDPALKEGWKNELKEVSGRIISMRERLREELHKLKVPGDWSHITSQIGMFSYTGLTTPQCENMINKWHVHMLKNGRISMAGINSKNVVYLAQAIQDSVESATPRARL
jgi:aspartate/tyrosine/aromatic aminotransferase